MGQLKSEDIFEDDSFWADNKEYAATVIIHFFSYKSCVPCGELRSLYRNRRTVFHGLDQMLLMMEEIMDQAGYPQADLEHRCLKTCPNNPARFDTHEQTVDADSSTALTEWDRGLFREHITIQVYCRKNASMQGEARFPGEKINFRSSLELMGMIHQYLRCSEELNERKAE